MIDIEKLRECDGCARGLPVDGRGFHYNGVQSPWPCTADRGSTAGTPRTDALRAKFDQDWQTVRPEPEALTLAASHVDEAMAHARTLERALARRDELLRRWEQTIVGISAEELNKLALDTSRTLEGK